MHSMGSHYFTVKYNTCNDCCKVMGSHRVIIIAMYFILLWDFVFVARSWCYWVETCSCVWVKKKVIGCVSLMKEGLCLYDWSTPLQTNTVSTHILLFFNVCLNNLHINLNSLHVYECPCLQSRHLLLSHSGTFIFLLRFHASTLRSSRACLLAHVMDACLNLSSLVRQ
jgi:uncharacterized protein involved in tolerance to divalent cations